MGVVIQFLTKGVGAGVGLASEAIKHRKATKAAEKAGTPPASSAGEGSSAAASRESYFNGAPPQYAEVSDEVGERLIAQGQAVRVDEKDVRNYPHGGNIISGEEGDEAAWELDEATAHLEETQSEAPPTQQDVNTLLTEFVRNNPPPAYSQIQPRLPCPVILPQRRPRDRTRGFVRAYAPVLEGVGIDQATFMDFLKTFKKASDSDGWLEVVNIAAFGAGFVPSGIAMGVSALVQVAVKVAKEVQRSTRTNSFLDRMNNEFFQPRGLYCLIMTYKPDSTATHASMDINQTILANSTPASNRARQTLRNLRGSSGKSYGELELPESAPLIFPGLEQIAEDASEEGAQKQKSVKSRSGRFVADYYDRRAQALWNHQNPNSKLVVPGPQPEFASRYSDPNHPASNGSIVSLLTGGRVNPFAMKEQERIKRRQKRAVWTGQPTDQVTGESKKDAYVKRILTKDVLYLMIVNLPTEEELQATRQAAANENAWRQQ